MPTGYTVAIEKGITFREFALDCARAFGALISIRDSARDTEIPREIKPDDYHLKEFANSKIKLAEIKKITLEEAKAFAKQDYYQSMDRYKNSLKQIKALEKKYLDMLENIKHWTPPTSGHKRLKKFMTEQIQESMKHDCNTEYCHKPILVTPKKWIKNKIESYTDNIKYHSKHWSKEVKRCHSSTKWLQELFASLEGLK